MRIKQAESRELPSLVALAYKLWPQAEDLEEEFLQNMADGAFFLAYQEVTPVGFAQCQLRHDYVEGTESSPVGYLEGVYVEEEYRRHGIGKALVAACQQWAKSRGCSEFASDCELSNRESLQFHLSAGFQEANRIVCFTKKL